MGGSSKQTVGYSYYANWSVGFTKRATELRKIWYGGRLAWEGVLTESGYIYIDARDLFGGDKKAGGLQGSCYVNFGREGDVLPDEIKNYHETPELCPNYKGIVSLHFIDCYVASMVNYVNEIEISAFWEPTDELGDPTIDDSINPISLMYDILTRDGADRWIARPVKNINKVSFIDAFNKESDGSNYVSANFDSDSDVSDILADLFSITNTQVVNDGQGNVQIISFGELSQSDIDNATTFDKSNIKRGSIGSIKISFGSVGIGGMQIVYTKQDEDYTRSYISRNASDVDIQQRLTIETKPLIDNISTAANISTQDIVKQSANNITANIIISSSMASIAPEVGEASLLDLSAIFDNDITNKDNYSQIIVTRCVEKSLDLDNEEISLTFTEDVFTRAAASSLDPEEFDPPDFNKVNKAVPLLNRKTINAPYFIFEAELFTQDQLNNSTSGYLMSFGEPDPAYNAINFDLYNSLDLNSYSYGGTGGFTFSGKTYSAIDLFSTTVAAAFNLSKISIDITSKNRYVFLIGGTEFIYLTVDIGQDIYNQNTVYEIERGLFDTIPKEHPVNTTMFYICKEDEITRNWGLTDNSYAVGLNVGTKLLTRTTQELLPLNQSAQEVASITARHYLPLRLSACNINGDFWEHSRSVPVDFDRSDGTTVAFYSRNRELERSNLATSYYDEIGDNPELNVFYEIEFKDNVSGKSVIKTDSMFNQSAFTEVMTYGEEADTFGGISSDISVYCKTYKLTDGNKVYSHESPVISVLTESPPPVLISFKLDLTDKVLDVGQYADFQIEDLIQEGAFTDFSYISLDDSIATIEDGRVLGVSRGSTTITATDSGTGISSSVGVRVV